MVYIKKLLTNNKFLRTFCNQIEQEQSIYFVSIVEFLYIKVVLIRFTTAALDSELGTAAVAQW